MPREHAPPVFEVEALVVILEDPAEVPVEVKPELASPVSMGNFWAADLTAISSAPAVLCLLNSDSLHDCDMPESVKAYEPARALWPQTGVLEESLERPFPR